MAATRLIALHANKGKTIARSLSDRTDYAKNPDKTEKGELVTGYRCDPFTVDEEFMLAKRKYEQITGRHQRRDVIAYQIRQSFKPGEITLEEANRLGRELALRFTKGKFAFIVTTHTDRAHIHNHIVFNSTSLDGTRKFKNFWFSGLALQRLSDLVCLENSLSVIEAKPIGEREKGRNTPHGQASVTSSVGILTGYFKRNRRALRQFSFSYSNLAMKSSGGNIFQLRTGIRSALSAYPHFRKDIEKRKFARHSPTKQSMKADHTQGLNARSICSLIFRANCSPRAKASSAGRRSITSNRCQRRCCFSVTIRLIVLIS